MKMILDYLRLTLFIGGALIGVQVPSFVDQYQLRLEAHLLESNRALNEFQKDADKFFAGDITQLIQHYRRTNDPVFKDGGQSIQALVSRHQVLSESLDEFRKTFYSPYTQTLASPVKEIRREAWQRYDYAVTLNSQGIAWALAAGFTIALLIDILLTSLRGIFTITRRAPKTRPQPPEL